MSDQRGQNSKHTKTVEKVRSILASFFSSHVVTLFEKTDDFLFEAANSASSTAEQNRMFEFMSALRVDKETIEKNFTEELRTYLKPISQQKELPQKKHKDDQGDSAELSLVAQDEMDELVTLSIISGKATTDMQEAISHLGTRLEELGKRNLGVFHHDALKPIHICDAFQDALEDKGYQQQDKLLLYKMFGEEVITPLKELYEELNKFLIEQGVMPKIEYHSNVSNRGADYSTGSYDEPVDDSFEETDAGDYMGGAPAGGGGGSAGRGGAGARAGGAGAGSGPAGGSGSYGGAPAGASGTAASAGQSSGSGDQRMSAGYSAGHIQQAVHDFLGGDPAQMDEGGASSGGAGGAYFTRHEVVGALSNMQSQVQIQPSDKLEFNAAAIKRAVLSTIGEQTGGVVNKAVHQLTEKTIDFIKLIFDAIIEDKSITDAIKTLLLSLQIPVIKAAMLDAEFFVDDQHPARLLLDKLAEAGVGVSEHTDEVYISVNLIVKKLLNEFEEDVAVFKNAYEELTELVEGIYSQAQEREQQSYAEVQHAHARNIVLQEIRKTTLGKELPQGIRILVLKVWPSMMFNYFLKHGKANDEWIDMLMILSKIIESMQVSGSMTELEDLGFSFDDLVKTAEHKLETSYKKKGLIKAVIADLRSTHEQVMEKRQAQQKVEKKDGTALEQLIAQSREQVPEEKELIEEVPEQEAEKVEEQSAEEIAKIKLAKLPDAIKPGTWCIVYNGEDKPVRRLKLAIMLVQDATLVFVDHMGNVVIEKDAEVFASELERDLSGVIMQHSVFDHALSSALGSITSTKH